MISRAERFFDNMRGRKVALMGIGVTNTGLIKLLHEKEAIVTACDKRERGELGAAADELESLGIKLKLGEGYFDGLDAEILFRTPGMNYNLPKLQEFRENGGVVTSEMEVFFDICPCRIIAVTGSDGKTTTSTLISEILKRRGKTVYLGGNIGKALLPQVLTMDESDFAVVELSSFQLISMRSSPQIAVVTNVAPNHLDVHVTMDEYVNAKKNIFMHQNAFSRTVLSFDNGITKSFVPEIRGKCLGFSLDAPVNRGAWLEKDGTIMFRDGENTVAIMNSKDIRLPGAHNISNYLAAICAVAEFAVPETIGHVARTFSGVEHRIEFVREINGVKWYNDSIATSPTRAIAGLKSFDNKLIMIAGGYDKQIPFEPLAPEIVKSVKLLILSGPTGPKIEAAVKACPDFREGLPAIIRVSGLPQAVQAASREAKPGDVVSLSPASASFDAYPNFEARGRHFKELVNALG